MKNGVPDGNGTLNSIFDGMGYTYVGEFKRGKKMEEAIYLPKIINIIMMELGKMIKKMGLVHYLIMGINILGTLRMINIVEMGHFVAKMGRYMNASLEMENRMDLEELHL